MQRAPKWITQLDNEHVAQYWGQLVEKYPTAPDPVMIVREIGDVHFSWDCQWRYIELEILADGRIEWFYRNRTNNVLAGTEDEPDYEIPAEFHFYFGQIFGPCE